MNELFKLTRQHYEKNETEASLLSKVTKILESLPDGSVDSSQLAAWNDVTKEALKWIVQQKPPTQGFNLGVVMGPRFAEMSANLARNLREGRVCFVMGVCTAASTRS